MTLTTKITAILTMLTIPYASFADTENKKYDVIGLGNALVDIIAYVSEQEIYKLMPKDFKKGDTNKIDDLMATEITSKMINAEIIAGGSTANVMVGISSLGGKTGFNTIVADDKLGRLFKQSMLDANVDYLSKIDKNLTQNTARCLTFITPDKERTFAVSSGISNRLNEEFIDYSSIKNSKVFYTDSSILDNNGMKSKAAISALKIANENNVATAFNLHNNYYIAHYGAEIISLLPKIDIIIGSEKEGMDLLGKTNITETINQFLKYSKIVIMTQGKEGALIATKDETIHIPSVADPSRVIDLNGAGDAFSSGFLYGYTHNYSLKESGQLGAKVSAEIIYQTGARTKTNLKAKVLIQ
jgi:sugar/nucleoside kinase (ribokinase family)